MAGLESILLALVWLLFLPFMMFGAILAYLGEEISRVFQPHLLLSGIWVGGMGAWLLRGSTPDDSQPYLTLTEVIAQSHVGPIPAPFAMFALAGVLVIAAALVALRQRQLPA